MEVYMSMSINDFFKCPFALDRIHNCGYLSPYINPFTNWMAENHFSDYSIRAGITNVAHLSQSLKDSEPNIRDFNNIIQEFLYKHIPNCKCKGWKQPKKIKYISYSLNRFKKYLSTNSDIKLITSEKLAYPEIHKEYLYWLSKKFDLQDSTVALRSSYLKQFLSWVKEESPYQKLIELKPYDVESFYIKATSKWGKSYKRSLQATLRSFFDFCHEMKYTLQNLRYSLTVIKTYKLSEVPKKIDENEAIKLIDSIDRSTLSGKRNYAILKLLNTYGVRGCQVRALKIKDIDWHKEEICFSSARGGKSCTFPLLTEVGNALLDYLENVRKKCRYPEVFLTLRAPYKPLTKSQVLPQMIRTAMIKTGINSPSKGAHCFRHGFVSKMIEQGESFKHISDLSGHKHIQTTFIYTKIDFNSLGEVALELPEVEDEKS